MAAVSQSPIARASVALRRRPARIAAISAGSEPFSRNSTPASWMAVPSLRSSAPS